MRSLSHGEKLDAEGCYNSVEEEKDKREVCGLSPIYTMLSVAEATEGRVLDNAQAHEPEAGSVVTYASMSFYS